MITITNGRAASPSSRERVLDQDPMEVNIWLHRFAVIVAASTLLLIFVGGLVTSTESGLAVPDWPLSYGQFFPRMVGGILYEHGHRMVAALVGLLIMIEAAWLFRREPRKWVRWLGALAVFAVICQGILGGITVLLLLPPVVSVGHAGLAEIVLCLTVTIALVTSRGWQESDKRTMDTGSPSLRMLTTVTTAVVYCQILLGALMRHTGSGLAIPDFPLSFGHVIPPHFTRQILVHYSHRVGAVIVAFLILWVTARILRNHAEEKALRLTAFVLLSALIVQLFLGAETIWSGKGVISTTLHVAGGAFTLATSLFLALTVRRILVLQPASQRVPVPDAGAVME
ncbi:MAG TPA: COX15/CtaA family protein [Acidobacteriota bacterium]|nr:COX15/CtaA family protein [Acidobacteriota bacterium]